MPFRQLFLLIAGGLTLGLGYFLLAPFFKTAPRITRLRAYLADPSAHPDWKSSVIIRLPRDPFDETRQIWVYYTHMADAQGNYSGDPHHPVGMHLHFSIVQADGRGRFKNELKIENTLDPSPYLGLRGKVSDDWSKPVICD